MPSHITNITNTPMFRFKQFFVDDADCAMKVGTDGVLLGAWATHPSPFRILDIGTGSGLVALMLAQRYPLAQIVGIDIDEGAVSAANKNFHASPWGERLRAERCEVQEYGMTFALTDTTRPQTPSLNKGGGNHAAGEKEYASFGFSLVVSNPPYFQNSLKAPDKQRSMARHTDTLSYRDLVSHAARLMATDGVFAVIVPAAEETTLTMLAATEGLFPIHITHVYSKKGKPAKRVLMAFKRCLNGDTKETSLILEDEAGGRSEDYQRLAGEFYL